MKRRTLTAQAFAFADPPPVGVALMVASQRFDLVEVEPYTRRDGEASEIAVWSASCRSCGVEFRQQASRLRFPQTRRCEQCRQTPAPQQDEAE